MTRRVACTIILDGTDDEGWFQQDEKVHRVINREMILDVGQPAQNVRIPDVRWGGECRVELDLTARAVEDGLVQIEGNAKFFEGTTEHTHDLEDHQTVSFTVPRGGRPTHHFIQLRNEEANGGDHAEVSISCTNSLIEDD